MFSIVVYKYHNEYGPRDNTRLMLPFITQVVQHKRILDAKGIKTWAIVVLGLHPKRKVICKNEEVNVVPL